MKIRELWLKAKGEASVLRGHPWIMKNMIKEPSLVSEDGDIVRILSPKGCQLGYAHLDLSNDIVGRMIEFSSKYTDFSKDYWYKKFEAARVWRKNIIDHHTTGYRLIFSEGDGLPGIVCDIYDKLAVVQLGTPGARTLKELLSSYLIEQLNVTSVYNKSLKFGDADHWLSGAEASDHCQTEPLVTHIVPFQENGIQFVADIIQGHKTGFYFDQRDNRQLVKKLSQDKNVLNMFSYSGGFSIYSLMGGARLVTSVDSSQPALSLLQDNLKLNSMAERHHSVHADAFDFLDQCQSDFYDMIILDPPAFAKHSNAVHAGLKGYTNLCRKALLKIKRHGTLLVYSCSQNISDLALRDCLKQAALYTQRNVYIGSALSQAADHPYHVCHPEGHYLNGFLAYVI